MSAGNSVSNVRFLHFFDFPGEGGLNVGTEVDGFGYAWIPPRYLALPDVDALKTLAVKCGSEHVSEAEATALRKE